MQIAEPKTQSKPVGRLPGEEGIWFFVVGDLFVFSLFFGTYLFYRGAAPTEYDSWQTELDLFWGGTNTIILLTSSWLVARAVAATRQQNMVSTRTNLIGAITLGVAFCCIKIFEYGDKFADGRGVGTSDFFMFFLMLTGIHLIHVLIGILVLVLVLMRTKPNTDRTSYTLLIENSATYWHLVDVLWIILFSLLYLLRS